MKTKISYILLLMGSIITFSSQVSAQTLATPNQTSISDTIKYTCSMHPDVISDKPGQCPKCGMTLIVMGKTDTQKNKMNMMMCPMHGMVGMNHNHAGEANGKKSWANPLYIGMGVIMVVMMTFMIISIGSR